MVGDAYDVISAAVGKDLLTGEQIGKVGVGVTLAGTVFGSGKLAREAGYGLLTLGRKATRKMDADPLFHGFPRLLESDILSGAPALVRRNGRAEYLAPGSINGVDGMYHITRKGDEITHRVFIPNSDWQRYSRRHGLPQGGQ